MKQQKLNTEDIMTIPTHFSPDYTLQSLSYLEEANAKLSVAKTILESQKLVDEKQIEQLLIIQNQIEDFEDLLKSSKH